MKFLQLFLVVFGIIFSPITSYAQEMYTTTSLNVRAAPNTDSEIITTLSYNTKVETVGYVDDWKCIRLGDKLHFVKEEYLSTDPQPDLYSKEDLYFLSHIINAEMGCESLEDKIYTGSVVLNRKNGDPWWSQGLHTIEAVVFRKGQYQPTWNGSFYNTPNEESVRAAIYLLENGSQIPSNVVFQAEFKQGSGVWKKTKGAYYCYK